METKTMEERIAKLEGEVIRIDSAVQGIPDAVLDKVASGLADIVGTQLHQLMLIESGNIVATGCKQLAAGVAKGTYDVGKKVVVMPIKAARWGYEKAVGLFGYRMAKDDAVEVEPEAAPEAAPATA